LLRRTIMKQVLTAILFTSAFTANLMGQFPGCPDIDAGPDVTTPCPNTCVTLTAAPILSGLTTSYTVSSIPHEPPIAYNAVGGTAISVNTDDVWSNLITLPFPFCYYGQTYTNCRVGSNGAIRLGTLGTDGGYHPWEFTNAVPSPNLVDAGNIYGVYHDIDPSIFVPNGGFVRWYLLGEAPCRIFVVTFYELAHFSCNNLRSTHMMVLYETTNVIDVYVEKKQTCSNWNGGRAVIGIQNQNGTQGIAAPGRNTGNWSVNTPEAWRFTPAGTPTYTVAWTANGQNVGNGLNIEVCPNQTTTYTATVTYTPCAGGTSVVVSDDVTVNVNQGILPSFAPSQSFCQGTQIPPLPITSQNGITGSWSPAINNQQTTTYTFTPNPNQCASPVQVTIPVTPTITPSFNFPLTQCQGANIPALPTTSLNGISGTWSPVLNNQQTTTYTFTPNTAGLNQCAQAVQQTIQIVTIQTPNFTQQGPYCQGTAIPALPTTSLNGISGTWSPGINNQQTTTYTFTPTAGECASGPVSMTIVINPNITPTFANVAPVCAGTPIPALPTTSLNGITGIWSPVINNQQTTTYTFTATSPGCFNTASLTIDILPLGISNNTASACANQLPYVWNGQNLTQTGNYTSFFTAANGCDSIAYLAFTVLPILQSNTIMNICEDQIPYTWNGLSIAQTGLYTVTLTSSFGCDSIANLDATIRPLPVVSFEADLLSDCGRVSTNFLNTSPEGSYVSTQWNFGDGTFSNALHAVNKVYDTPGCYDVTLTLTTSFGCSNQASKPDYICVFPNPVAAFIVNPNPLTEFENTANFVNLSTNTNDQFWDFGHLGATSSAFSPSYTYPVDRPDFFYVWLYVSNEFGCVDSTSQQVIVVLEPTYYVPNTFTPDGDKFNNIFLPVFTSGFDPYDYKLLIFNRWGEVLFESNNASVGWDGTYGGQMMQDGVYIYQIEFKEEFTDNRHVLRGHVNLLR
jgi:gliding motility-associated-like protein